MKSVNLGIVYIGTIIIVLVALFFSGAVTTGEEMALDEYQIQACYLRQKIEQIDTDLTTMVRIKMFLQAELAQVERQIAAAQPKKEEPDVKLDEKMINPSIDKPGGNKK